MTNLSCKFIYNHKLCRSKHPAVLTREDSHVLVKDDLMLPEKMG